MDYIAHRVPETGREQSILDHLTGTAERASRYAAAFGAAELGHTCGMLHDIGKYSEKFQRRIRGSSEKTDHSTAGALEAMNLLNVPVAFCVAGHHGGLPDGGNKRAATSTDTTFFGKMKRTIGNDIEDYSAYKTEVLIHNAQWPTDLLPDNQSAFFFTRMLYSCLVDADYLNTEEFISGEKVERGGGECLAVLFDKLTLYISPWWDAKTELNIKRCEILRALIDGSETKSGLFTITVPTGGGKTVSSMAFALKHALKNGLKRVIYVIPYTSIIEQTQAEFEKIFGAENVVAHYANIDYSTDENGGITDKRYLAAENWDAPIILTTTVQFFESLYANRSSRCRKLHNIVNSVIIFDEAQMLPVPYLKPCVSAISQLVKHYGCSAVLCTATQPALNRLFKDTLSEYEPQELCPDVPAMYAIFRRVCYKKAGRLTDTELAERLNKEKQVLCIVNNRKQAQAIFTLLDGEGNYHLSTTMYPAHRRQVLAEIRRRLLDGNPCRVVSTSLVEAGVDVDFPTVYRAFAGLDSMIQAGGRCNREGKGRLEESVVWLFETEQKAPQIMRQNISAAERVMRNYDDISAPEAVKAYFEFLLYTLKPESELDKKEIQSEINSGVMPFATVSERLHIIENTEFTIYIPLEDAGALVENLRKIGVSRNLMRKLGQYAVGVYPNHFKELVELGAAVKVTENAAVLLDMKLYNQKTGLSFGVNEGQGLIV